MRQTWECSTDHVYSVYIGLKFSRDSLSSSLVISPTWLPTESFTRLCSYWTLYLVVATTLSTFFILVGIFHSITAFTLLFSICTSPYPTTTSRIEIPLASKSHFDHLKHRLCFSAIFKNQIILFSSSFLVLVDITKSYI